MSKDEICQRLNDISRLGLTSIEMLRRIKEKDVDSETLIENTQMVLNSILQTLPQIALDIMKL